MPDNPAKQSEFPPERTAPPESTGRWWIASLLALVLCSNLGLLLALFNPDKETDFIKIRSFLWIGGGILVGTLLSLIFGVISFVRRERRRWWCLLTALPAVCLVLGLSGQLVQQQDRQRTAQAFLAANQAALAQLRADPTIALREHWDQSSNGHRLLALQSSFTDPRVPYTPALLQRFYNEAPTMRDLLFAHPACTAEFLSAHFQEAWDQSAKNQGAMLANIVGNPNTPLPLVEKVAQAKNLPGAPLLAARHALEKRTPPPRP